MIAVTLCQCGSGLEAEWLYDARGIELCKACPACRADKLAGFRPEVLTDVDYETTEDVDGDDGLTWEDEEVLREGHMWTFEWRLKGEEEWRKAADHPLAQKFEMNSTWNLAIHAAAAASGFMAGRADQGEILEIRLARKEN